MVMESNRTWEARICNWSLPFHYDTCNPIWSPEFAVRYLDSNTPLIPLSVLKLPLGGLACHLSKENLDTVLLHLYMANLSGPILMESTALL